MAPKVILNSTQFKLTITRLCHELIENHSNFANTVIVGVQPRGIHLANRIVNQLQQLTGNNIEGGTLDTTFYRDDFRRNDKTLLAEATLINTTIEGKKIILVDDVLHTGRTIRSAFDALLAFGRPSKIELLVLINRRYMREVPIQADYVGKTIDSIIEQKIKVHSKEIEGENEDVVALYQ